MKLNTLKMLGLTLLTSCAGRISSLQEELRVHVCNNILVQETNDDRMAVLRKIEWLAIERAGKRAVRVGDSLLVDLDTKSVIELIDCFNETADDSCAVYNLIDWNEAINSFIVDVTYWEGGETLLINATTGRRTYTLGAPILSPDKLNFVSIGCNYESDVFSGVQIWSTQNDEIRLDLQYIPDDLCPVASAWINNDLLLVKMTTVSNEPAGCVEFAQKGNSWKISHLCK